MTKHKHAELIKAWADGAQIEYKCTNLSAGTWCLAKSPTWNEGTEYRIYDKFRSLKEAYKAGKTIQYKTCTTDTWVDMNSPTWRDFGEYRVKPKVQYYVTITEDDGICPQIVAHKICLDIPEAVMDYVLTKESSIPVVPDDGTIINVNWTRPRTFNV